MLQGPHLVSGSERAHLLALRGDHDGALQALIDLVDSGWRYYSWGLGAYPEFAGIAERPEFIAMQARLDAGVRQEREYYERHRDLPLW